MYSYRIEQAIKAVAVLHDGQERKGHHPYPFCTHLYSVAYILMEYTTEEDIIIAGLLHDTLEDTDYTTEELEADFGVVVKQLVETLTEPSSTATKQLSWLERKQQYAAQLKAGPEGAVVIAAVDKIHNLRSMVEDYYHDHSRFMQDFGTRIDERVEAYQAIANVINKRLKGPLLEEFNHVFQTHLEFLYEVEKSQKANLYLSADPSTAAAE